MNEKELEILGILQEECAEVIVEISKIRRFGINSISHHTDVSHKKTLEMEIGDVLCMVDLLVEQGVVDNAALLVAKSKKRERLHNWSNIFKE